MRLLLLLLALSTPAWAVDPAQPHEVLYAPVDIPHLFIGFGDSASVIDCTQNVWAQVTNAGDNLYAVNDTLACSYVVGDTIRINMDGDYWMLASTSFSGNNGETWKLGFLTSAGALIDYSASRFTSNNDTGNVSVQAFHRCAAGDKIVFGIMNTSDGDDATMKYGTIVIRRQPTRR